jgi:hypothetical protein
MTNRLFIAALFVAGFFFSGCTTDLGMARLDSPESIAKSTRPVYLMTVNLKNELVPAYQPKLVALKIMKRTGPHSIRVLLVNVDQLSKEESFSPAIGNSYLVRFELEPGDYVLLGLNSVGQSMFTAANFFTPLWMTLHPSTPGVSYLGHIDAVVRKRQEGEFGAGGYSLPTQEQREVGAFGGTFDVTISDRWETDEAKFQQKVPALKGVEIHKNILPAFDRKSIQQWWNNNAFQTPLP